jgi:hypothetical protein
MNIRNINTNKPVYFYTVLFLNNYFPAKQESAEKPVTKLFEVSADSNSATVKWLDDETLFVRHNLKLPITLEMWDANNKPIFYCPILKDDIESMSVGDICKESDTSITLGFSNVQKPQGNQVYKLAIKSLPAFDLKEQNIVTTDLPLDEQVQTNQTGLAIIFRRNSLDSLFDLICSLDETYWHSMEETYDLQYLTQESCYKDCYFACKYTSELQDILDLIDLSEYQIKYSWQNKRA